MQSASNESSPEQPKINQIRNETPLEKYEQTLKQQEQTIQHEPAEQKLPQQIHSTATDNRQVNSYELMPKIRSKEDAYQILLYEAQMHLPSYDQTPMSFLKEVFAGRKKLLLYSELKPVNVPRLKEFCADRIYQLAMEDQRVFQYLPDPIKSKIRPVNKTFLFNV